MMESLVQFPATVTIFVILIPLIIFRHFWLANQKRKAQTRLELARILKKKEIKRREDFNEVRQKYKLNEESKKILLFDWPTLSHNLQTRQLTAQQVLAAFTAKALEATDFCNAVTEFNPTAFKIAQDLDKLDQVKGPLHGIPFCVKDDTDIQGMDSTIGLAKNCFKPKTKSAALIQALESLGGIPFCKTNLPQLLFSYGSDNPVFGQTTSSHSKKLGPGGSSSGTGALVGSRGCFFGTGTDIGGSVRIPAHCNGVAALKPTPGRLSLQGFTSPTPNILGLTCTPGIIGQDAHVVSCVYKYLLENNFQSQFDLKMPPITWNDKLFSKEKKLRIGYFTGENLDYVPAIGDTPETIMTAASALTSLGHTLIPIKVPTLDRFFRVEIDYAFSDQARDLYRCWEGEEIAGCMEQLEMGLRLPTWALKIVAFLMQQKTLLPFMYTPRLAPYTHSMALDGVNLRKTTGEQIKLIEELIEDWTQLKLDACICPTMPCPTLPINSPPDMPLGTVYTVPWNVTNFPAGVVKFGIETGKLIDNYDTKGDIVLERCKKLCKESVGAPLSVQIVGFPYQEEMVLRIMEELEDFKANNLI